MTREELQQAAMEYCGEDTRLQSAFMFGADYAWEHPHWIPVEEKLPEEGQEVFAWNGTFKESYKCIYHDGLFEDYLGALGKGAVTHWMPIVPPRKEE